MHAPLRLSIAALLILTAAAGADAAPRKKAEPEATELANPAAQPNAVGAGQFVAMPEPTGGRAKQPSAVFAAVKDALFVVYAAKTIDDLKTGKISQGSAVVIAPQVLLTNCHVVTQRPYIMLFQEKDTKNEVRSQADVTLSQDKSDRCILKTRDKLPLKPVSGVRPYDSLKVGEKVYAVGAPIGQERTLSEGIISGLRTSNGRRVVQTSAPISPGSSGGGLFDAHGNLVGITTYGLKEGNNLNFALAAEDYWR